ncbi:MAG TPA: sulfurtransferase-like selenium metabolism protein YedF [Firmicutes bacterium]|nr:sulfurtransferase-like selenium metabolism protein YedF [Bacillota bacterium]
MKRTVDAKGLSCPLPVVEARKALQEMSAGELEVLVDNIIALQNLEKMAREAELKYSAETLGKGHHRIRIFVGDGISEPKAAVKKKAAKKERDVVLVLSSEFMGQGDRALGTILMKSFIYALSEQDELPAKILLYNSGVKLAAQGSDALEDLKKLAGRGVEILSCGVCLDFYQIADALEVGSVSNMYDICRIQMEADHLIRP